MDQIAAMRTICRVAELQSFSRAARQVGLSPAVVSRQVAAMEAELGVRLFDRSTRHVAMTDAGRQYCDASIELLDRYDELLATVKGHTERPTGLLRITAPLDFGLMYLRPAIREFLSRESGIRVEVHFEDRVVDFLAENFDIALRIGSLADSSLVARRLGQACIGCYASPDYLALHGEPQHPEEFGTHEVLEYVLASTPGAWQFSCAGRTVNVAVQGRISANNGRALADAASEGLGIVRLPEFLVSDHVQEGRLIEILADYRSDPLTISLLYPHRRFNPAKIRVFVDFMRQHFADLWS